MTATPLNQKSTIQEITARFDVDVDRFSSLETAQMSTLDAPLAMELITKAAIEVTPKICHVLDIGCGAGNNTVRLLREYSSKLNHRANVDCDLLDLSQPMLERASERVTGETDGTVKLVRGDFREIALEAERYDVVVAAAVFHHLRDDSDWLAAFRKVYTILRPGGSLWITDLVSHELPAVQSMMFRRYGDYLSEIGGEDYQRKVFEYIDREDSPRPVSYQLDLMRNVGFMNLDILHKNSCFAAFGGQKGRFPTG